MMIPNTTDRETGAHFAAAAEHRLDIKACLNCDRGIHPPMPQCPYCGSIKTEWRQAAGRGTLHTWTVVTHQVHPDFPVPYTLVVVELDDFADIRLVGHMDGAQDLAMGEPMEVTFDALVEGVVLPNWKPVRISE